MKPAWPSSPGGGSAGDPSRLNRVATRRVVRSSLTRFGFGRNTPGPVLPVGAPPSRALSAGRWGPRQPRRSPGFHHRLLTASLRAARRCVSVEIHPGQFSRWGLLPHAPCQPDPHRENWASPASALTRVPPQAVNRVAARRSSLRFGRNTPGPVLPVGAPPSRALSAGPPPGELGLASLGAHATLSTGCQCSRRLITRKTPGVLRAMDSRIRDSIALRTTPVSATTPRETTMWIGGFTRLARSEKRESR